MSVNKTILPVLLSWLCLAPVLNADQKALQSYSRGDAASAFESLCRSAESAPSDPRTFVALAEIPDYLDLVPNFDRVTNAFKTVMVSSTDRFLRYTAADKLYAYFLRRGMIDRAAGLLNRISFVTQWSVLGTFRAMGRADLDLGFAAFETNLPKAPVRQAATGVVETASFSPEGWLRPFDRFEQADGIVYATAFFSVPADGTYYLHVISDDPLRLWLNDQFACRNDPSTGGGRNLFLRLGIKKGWQKLVIKVLADGSAPSLRVSVLDAKWEKPERFAAGRAVQACSRTVEAAVISCPQFAYFENKTASYGMKPDDNYLFSLAKRDNGQMNDFYRYLYKALDSDRKNPLFKLCYSTAVIDDEGEHNNSARADLAVRYLKELSAAGMPAAWDLLGKYYARQRRVKEAGDAFQKAWLSATNSAAFLVHRMEFFYQQGWTAEFVQAAERTLRTVPGSIRPNALLADYYSSRSLSCATNYYSRIAAVWPYDPSVLEYARFCASAGDYGKALGLVGRLETFYTEWESLAAFKADLLAATSDRDRSLRLYGSLVARYPFSHDLLRSAGRNLLKFGKPEGVDLLKRALDVRPADLDLADEISQLEKDRPWTLESYLDSPATKGLISGFRSSRTNDRSVSAAVLQDEEVLKVNPDGTCVRLVHQLISINDKQGIEDWGSPSIDSLRGTRILSAVTHLRDGSSVDVSTIQRQGGKLVLSFPALEENCLIELTYMESSGRDRVTGTEIFQSDPSVLRLPETPVGRMVHTLILPMKAELAVIRRNFSGSNLISVTERTEGRERVIRISTSNVPALKSEPLMPPLYDVVPSVSVTGFPADAENLCRWYGALWSSARSDSVELNRLLMELSGNSNLSNRGLTRIRRIYSWIADNIVTDGYYLYSADPLRKTVDSRSATSEQKVLLMKYFLDKIDAKSDILLARTADAFRESVTNLSPAFFNDAVLKLTFGAETYYLDFNSKYFPFGAMGWDKFGAPCLNVSTAEFERLPSVDGKSGRVSFSNVITVGSNADLGLAGVRSYEGCYSVYQELFEDISTRDLNVNQMENRDIRGLSVTNSAFFTPADGGPGFGYSIGAKVVNGVTARGAEIDVPLLCRKANLGESFISRSERELPLKISQPLFYSQKLVYRFGHASGSVIGLPDDYSATNMFGRYTIGYEKTPDGTVEVNIDLWLPPQTVQTGDYAQFSRFCSDVDRKEKEVIVLKR